ncbi:hypothetical protein TsFJ059_005254 [Trichoderma semiorbis]|uniref:Uncharacterized protein n=1 Tax=Trichoderma semiorbis TaxID=1491008 RepID=A0A9P8HTG6_9HYPO|nr:hypothetical protein TsFJ059_005254 [Trichoderma semiorbis]
MMATQPMVCLQSAAPSASGFAFAAEAAHLTPVASWTPPGLLELGLAAVGRSKGTSGLERSFLQASRFAVGWIRRPPHPSIGDQLNDELISNGALSVTSSLSLTGSQYFIFAAKIFPQWAQMESLTSHMLFYINMMSSYKSDIYGNANAYSTTLPPACLAHLDWLFREPHQPRGPVGFSSVVVVSVVSQAIIATAIQTTNSPKYHDDNLENANFIGTCK